MLKAVLSAKLENHYIQIQKLKSDIKFYEDKKNLSKLFSALTMNGGAEHRDVYPLSEDLTVSFTKSNVIVTKIGIASLYFSNMEFEEFLTTLSLSDNWQERREHIGQYTFLFHEDRYKRVLKIYTNYGERYLFRFEEEHVKLIHGYINVLFNINCEWFQKESV